MQNPHERAADTRMRETSLTPADSLDPDSLEPLVDTPPAYVKEPLFNKKVMLAWALGAAAVWFAVSVILPMAMETAKTSIRQAVEEAEKGSDGTITIRRNGKVITITRDPAPGVTITPDTKGAPAATPVAAPAAALPPTEPAKLPEKKR